MIDRDFYRLPELAERWACTVHDLLHLGIQDRAQVCVNIYGMASGSSRTRMETEAAEASPDDDPLTDEELREAEVHDAAFQRWKARTTKDMPHGVFELAHDDLRFLEMPDAFPYELGEALKFDGGWWECEFDPPVAISIDHLCMLHEEVMRIQREMFSSFSALPLAREPVGELGSGFYRRAVFPAAGMARTAVSLIDAAMWLLGVESVEAISGCNIKEREAFGSRFHQALEDVEIAVAMCELKATSIETTRARRIEEHLHDIVDSVAKAGGLQVELNQGAHVYLVPRELKDWWARRNALLESANPVGSRLKDVTLWPNHTTRKLGALRLAAFRFWGENYDPSEPDTAPKNEAVIAWLQKEHGIGATPAAEMASILRPETLRTGPR